METMQLERFVKRCDTKIEAARAIGVKPNVLSNWLARSPGEYELTVTTDMQVLKVMKLVRT